MKKFRKKISRYTRPFVILILLIIALSIFFYRDALLQFFQNELSPLPTTNGTAIMYSGILPCADCSGLETSLTLHPSAANPNVGTYTLKQIYQGKQVSPLIETGIWTITTKSFNGKTTNVYRFTADKTNQTTYYMQVNDVHLQLLDTEGNEIVAPFNTTLTKQQ